MRAFWIGLVWFVSLIVAYYSGWFKGLRSASTVAAGTANIMGNTLEYSFFALLIFAALGVGYYFYSKSTLLNPGHRN